MLYACSFKSHLKKVISDIHCFMVVPFSGLVVNGRGQLAECLPPKKKMVKKLEKLERSSQKMEKIGQKSGKSGKNQVKNEKKKEKVKPNIKKKRKNQ